MLAVQGVCKGHGEQASQVDTLMKEAGHDIGRAHCCNDEGHQSGY
jgi:hypothetical protein